MSWRDDYYGFYPIDTTLYDHRYFSDDDRYSIPEDRRYPKLLVSPVYQHGRMMAMDITAKDDIPDWLIGYVRSVVFLPNMVPMNLRSVAEIQAQVDSISCSLVRGGGLFWYGSGWRSRGNIFVYRTSPTDQLQRDLKAAQESIRTLQAQRDAAQTRVAFLEAEQ